VRPPSHGRAEGTRFESSLQAVFGGDGERDTLKRELKREGEGDTLKRELKREGEGDTLKRELKREGEGDTLKRELKRGRRRFESSLQAVFGRPERGHAEA